MISIPAKIGRYEVVSRIARGGMGTLYLAWDPKLDRQIAIKILIDDNDELRERFAREARSVASLHHLHIVTIFDVGEFEGQPFIAMEYVHGETLQALIRARLVLTMARKLEIIEQLCEGLAFAHRAGIVHRDVKPANMILQLDGSLKILDFGIARIAKSSGMTHAGMLIGTLNYMSPEQVSGQVADNRSDVFAVGAVMYELLSYRQAFPGGIEDGILYRLMNESPEPLEDVCPGLDPEIFRIVSRALEKDPRKRYPDLKLMSNDLRRIRMRLPTGDTTMSASDVPGYVPPALPATLSTVAEPSRRAADREELNRRRARQIDEYLDSAQHALTDGDYEAGISACEQVLMLDAENATAIELLDRARAVLDERRAEEWLTEAASEMERGALTSALAKIDRAAALTPSSARVAELRKAAEEALAARERARQRTEAIRKLIEQANEKFDQGLFQEATAAADEALALDAELSEAKAVKSRSLAAIQARERELVDRRARETVREARRLFASDNHAAALDLLTRFDGKHELVSHALEQLQAESSRIAAQRKLEAERRAKRERVAAELLGIRVDFDADDFATVLDRLRVLEEAEGSSPEIVNLRREAEAGRTAQELAAKIARDIAEHIARAAGLLARQDLAGAMTRIEAAVALDPNHKAALALRSKIQDRLRVVAEIRETDERRKRERAQAVAAAMAKARQAASHEVAIAALHEALDRDPENTEARLLLETRQNELARERAERLHQLEIARQEQIQRMLADVRDALHRGDIDGACAAIDRVLELDPANADAQSLLDEVQTVEEQRRDAIIPSAAPPDSESVLPSPEPTKRQETDRIDLATEVSQLVSRPPAVQPAAPHTPPKPVSPRRHLERRELYSALGVLAAIVVVAIVYALTRSDFVTPPPDNSGGVTASTPSTAAPQPTAQPSGLPPRIEAPKVPEAPTDPQAEQNARIDQRVDALRRLAQEQFARGDLRQALTTTIDALKLRPDDATLQRLHDQALTDARARLRQARDTATAAGEPARRSSSYREAAKREQDVPRLERAGRRDEAIRSLWLAADLFARATEEARRSATPSVSPTPPLVAAVPPAVESKPSPPEGPEPTQPPVNTTPLQAPAPRPEAPPTPAQVAPELSPPVRSAPTQPPLFSPPTRVSEEPAIVAVLQAYANAYSSRDAAAVKRVYPTVNEPALRQFFSASRSYQVQIQDRQISISGTEATVSCTWATVFEGEVGGPQRRAQKVVLGLQKSDGVWFIVSRR